MKPIQMNWFGALNNCLRKGLTLADLSNQRDFDGDIGPDPDLQAVVQVGSLSRLHNIGVAHVAHQFTAADVLEAPLRLQIVAAEPEVIEAHL